MATTRWHYSGEFRAKVALAAIRGDRTINELVAGEVSAAAFGWAKILHSRR